MNAIDQDHLDFLHSVAVSSKKNAAAILEHVIGDPRVPWFTEVPENLKIDAVPSKFMVGTEGAERNFKKFKAASGFPVDGSFVSSRLILAYTSDNFPALALLFVHNTATDEVGTLLMRVEGFCSLAPEYMMNSVKAIGERMSVTSKDDVAYSMAHVAQVLMNSSASHNRSHLSGASGIDHVEVDGITVYLYREFFDSDLEYQDTSVKLSPKMLPKVTSDYIRELKHFNNRLDVNLDPHGAKNLAELGTALEKSMEMWWASEDMSSLAWDVALSETEPEDLSYDELPAPSGIIWLNGAGGPALLNNHFLDKEFYETNEPVSEIASINAIAWFTPSKEARFIEGATPGVPHFVGLSASPSLARDSGQWNSFLSPIDFTSNMIEFWRMPSYELDQLREIARKVALTVLRLSREEIVGERREESVVSGSKKKRKIDRITYALLRRRKYSSDEERESEARQYSHRWIVRGHMRNQPVGGKPSDGAQKYERIWIAPYIKGPEDKPLVLKDRIQVWKR